MTLLLAVPGAAQAVVTVTTAADSGPGSLRAAIASSASGETIDFALPPNSPTITLTTGALMITHRLTISGPGAASLTVDGSNNNDSVFDIDITRPPPRR